MLSSKLITAFLSRDDFLKGLAAVTTAVEGREVPGGFTNTGIAYDSTLDCLWIGDWTNSKAIKCDKTLAKLGEITLTAQPQGIAYDSSDDTLWWSDNSNNFLRHVQKDGTNIPGDAINLGFAPNGCGYEAATDSVWVLDNANPTQAKRFSCASGTLLETITIAGSPALDGIAHDATNDTLWLVDDNVPGKIINANSSTGAVISSFTSHDNGENVAVDADGTLWYTDDAQFHAGTPDGNRVYHYTRGGGPLMYDGIILELSGSTITFHHQLGIDTYMDDAFPTLVTGRATNLRIGEFNGGARIWRTLIKPDLIWIPDRAIISSITLALYATTDFSSNARTMRVYRMRRSWTEGTGVDTETNDGANWNTYNGVNTWTAPGGFDSTDCEQSDIGSLALSASESVNAFKTVTLTPTTKGNLGLYGWMLKMDTETDDAYHFASYQNTDSTRWPTLTVVYTVPGW